MLREFKSSELIHMRKSLEDILLTVKSAIKVRSSFLTFDSVSQEDAAKYDSLREPEVYYNLRIFNRGLSIVRLYDKKMWSTFDPDDEKFHFALKFDNCNDLHISAFNLNNHSTSSTFYIGDWDNLDTAIQQFSRFIPYLLTKLFGNQPYLDFMHDIY